MSRSNSRTPVIPMSQPLPTNGCTCFSVPHFVTKRELDCVVAAAVILKQSEELLHICRRQKKDNQEGGKTATSWAHYPSGSTKGTGQWSVIKMLERFRTSSKPSRFDHMRQRPRQTSTFVLPQLMSADICCPLTLSLPSSLPATDHVICPHSPLKSNYHWLVDNSQPWPQRWHWLHHFMD